jgi:hypothetical protein
MGVPVQILSANPREELIFLTPEEPEFVWHAEAPLETRSAPPPPPSDTVVELPFLSLVLLALLAVVLLGGVVRRRLFGVRALVAAGVLGAGAFASRGVTVEVGLPWSPAAAAPAPETAREVFATLLENIYVAFDYREEGAIYDVLAQSVDGSLLDHIYREVYRSLILRDEGGAMSKVRSVDILRSEVMPAPPAEDGAAAFGIRATWRVDGYVRHWGHVHTRTNEYEAVYSVAARPEGWRIVAQTVLQQKRVADATEPTPESEPPESAASRAAGDAHR